MHGAKEEKSAQKAALRIRLWVFTSVSSSICMWGAYSSLGKEVLERLEGKYIGTWVNLYLTIQSRWTSTCVDVTYCTQNNSSALA
jgi:hypothetical protein